MIPPELSHAICVENGGKVSCVIGAGCSFEPPTSIPLAATLSADANWGLIQDGILLEGECADPGDLAELASLVFAKTGSQAALVAKLPIDRMRLARGNDGYRLLVALMAEGAVSHVLSLNFDLAVQNAAAELGITTIKVVDIPGESVPVGRVVVHLHGSASGSTEALVLRQEVIDDDWKQGWHQIVAQQILAAPNILFAGLGSAAPVLSETVEMIRDALGHQKTFYQADIADHSANYFAQQLDVPQDRYIKASWCDVMRELSARVVQQQVWTLVKTGVDILKANEAADEDIESFRTVARLLEKAPLLTLGKLRALARLDENSRYCSRTAADDESMTIPLVAVGKISVSTGLKVLPGLNGLWYLTKNERVRATILIATGRGCRKIAAMETPLKRLCKLFAEESGAPPDIVLAGGFISEPTQFNATPYDIVEGEPESDIVAGTRGPLLVIAETLDAPVRVKEWLHGE